MYCIKYSLSTPRRALSKPEIRCCVIKPRQGLISALWGFDNVIKSIKLFHVTT